MKWQPIETAPTDGTRILLRGRGGKIADGHYGQPDGFANPKRFVWPYINATPTHWAPLALIAAAPDLLSALVAAVELIETISPIEGDTVRHARSAIAKAVGHNAELRGATRPYRGASRLSDGLAILNTDGERNDAEKTGKTLES